MANLGELQARALQQYHGGDRAQAEQMAWEMLRLEPLHPEALYLLGVLELDAGRPLAALLRFHHATLLQPANPAFHNALGEAYRAAGPQAEAAACFREAIRLQPDYAAAHHALGLVMFDQGETDAAVASFRQALALRPDHEHAHLNLGRALHTKGDLEGARACYVEAIRLKPGYALAHNNLAMVLLAQGRHDEAVMRFREALRLQPNYPEAHCNLGISLEAQGELAAAAASLREAVRLRPDYARAHYQLGLLYEQQHHHAEAVACYQTAVRLNPDDAAAHYQLAGALMILGRWEASRAALEKEVALLPEQAEPFASLFYVRQRLCDWGTREADLERLWADVVRRLEQGQPPAINPWFALTCTPWTAGQLLAVARGKAQAIARSQEPLRQQLNFQHPRCCTGRLRVGYLSGDFCEHATAQLMRKLFSLHDRTDFEIFAYSFGPDDGSVYRRRIAADCDHFIDVAALSAADLARRIFADGIHLLIDLMGYSGFSRLEVLALRPAPVQASYLVYAGTTGAEFIDYLIGDRFVTPPELADAFSERLVLLPHSYQVNDPEQSIAPTPLRRAAYGLPEDGFVFCSFNNGYKFEPRIFGIWMKVLAQVPGSVLWLLSDEPAFEKNLRKEAVARGVAAERLVFAQRQPKAEHLARHRLADLFLDTYYCNAHTTASDALWAGLPLLTCPGQTFAARVAASLLTAIGLPELIAPDLEAYERLAVRLARQSDELRALREKLAAHRTTWPLFDTPRFARNLERAYRAMWEIHVSGRPPQPIVVTE